MKKLLLLSAALLACGLSQAQDVGRVISSTPIVQQVGQPRQVCTTEQVVVQQPKSGAGAFFGAIAGGVIGHAVGSGAGNAAATAIGAFGGAIVGDNIEGQSAAQLQNVQRCSTQTFFENRTIAYNVVYEYAGKQYSVQMPSDPGPTVQLQIAPVGAIQQAAPPMTTETYPQAAYAQQPTTIVLTQPAYPVYAPRLFYPPISLNFGYGYWGGGHDGHHTGYRR
jgi:uncharacterized protein YcfJ